MKTTGSKIKRAQRQHVLECALDTSEALWSFCAMPEAIPMARSLRKRWLRSADSDSTNKNGGRRRTPNAYRATIRIAKFASLAIVLLFLLATAAAIAQSQPKSPVGTWDCVLSGARGGVAYLTFSGDENGGTVTGLEIVVPKSSSQPHASLVATIATSGLGQRLPATNQPSASVAGSLPVAGQWGFDIKGRTIGFFTEIVPPLVRVICSTIPVIITNAQTLAVETNFFTSCVTNFSQVGLTNPVSFVGSVVPGKRLSLVAGSPLGSVTFRGAPAVDLTDVSGSWFGLESGNGGSAFEFFTLTPIPDFPNAYTVDGLGPNYSYNDGLALLSSQKIIAFALDIIDGSGSESIRATSGSFNARTLQANTTGTEAPPGLLSPANNIRFQVTRRPAIP